MTSVAPADLNRMTSQRLRRNARRSRERQDRRTIRPTTIDTPEPEAVESSAEPTVADLIEEAIQRAALSRGQTAVAEALARAIGGHDDR